MMQKKFFLGLAVAGLMLSGCTREVYLQPVPCEEDCPKCPCFVGASECCPETAVQTVVTTYQVYDVPAPAVTFVPCDNGVKRCRTVCKKVKVTH